MSAAVQAIRRQRHDARERPFIVIWESTRACPLACLHCRAEAVPDRDRRELDTAAAKNLLDQVAAFGQPAPLFVITGGDPFQRPDLTELTAYGREVGVRVAVSPSGTPTLTAERLRDLQSAGAVGLSLLSATAQQTLPVARWLAIHLFLLGAATTAIVVWSEHFAVAMLHAPQPDRRWSNARLAGVNTGVVGVLTGVWADLPALR
ncbi:radical SAM protein [Streptomyces sp. 2A115]|uniref:radical SAM protein n=1 Tax=Streptomyces sp. 2A115 TaxID=3457439 RepID=UPI003FD107F1